jgi:hypothetical protein
MQGRPSLDYITATLPICIRLVSPSTIREVGSRIRCDLTIVSQVDKSALLAELRRNELSRLADN